MRIFADSASDLPISFFDKNEVTLLPLHVLIDGKDYQDIVEIDSREVYKTIRKRRTTQNITSFS